MPTPLNEHFVDNTLGKEIEYSIQPYEWGRGKITKITHRVVEHKDFDPYRGGVWLKYECFDLEVAVEEGSHQGAFLCGVAVGKAEDLKGQMRYVTGVGYGQLCKAAHPKEGIKAQGIIIARCG